MGEIRHFLWVFSKHLYTFLIIFASDPFDFAERWFNVNYQPPFWLFWLLVAIAVSVSIILTIRELRQKTKRLDIANIPSLLNVMSKYLKKKTKNKIKRVQNVSNTPSNILELNNLLKKCLRVYGVTQDLPKPTKLPITERYRKSIQRRVPTELLEQMEQTDRSWELNMQVGGILDEEHYGLQLEGDTKYKKHETVVNDIAKHYIGICSENLTKKKNDFLIRMYATYSYLLFLGYWEILVDYAKHHGVDNIAYPETRGIVSLKYEGAEKYLSEELEKVKSSIRDILSEGKQKDGHK